MHVHEAIVEHTYPGGKLCLYLQASPPFGQVQNQPYLPFSTAAMKYLHTLSVVVLGLPCLLITTCRSLAKILVSILSDSRGSCHPHCWNWYIIPSSQSAMSSFFFCSSSSSFSFSLVSWYRSLFCPFLSILKSWLNLHFLPFSQLPALKN